jgi:hypothetical protein
MDIQWSFSNLFPSFILILRSAQNPWRVSVTKILAILIGFPSEKCVVNDITCEKYDGGDEIIFVPVDKTQELKFEQEHRLSSYQLDWNGETPTVTIQKLGDSSPSQQVEVPAGTEKVVVWEGNYYFFCRVKDLYCLTALPQGYKILEKSASE